MKYARGKKTKVKVENTSIKMKLSKKEFQTIQKAISKRMKKKGLKPKDVEEAIELVRKGYQTQPGTKEEFGVWKKEQVWGDE